MGWLARIHNLGLSSMFLVHHMQSEVEQDLLRAIYRAEQLPNLYLTSLVGHACSIQQDICITLGSVPSPLILSIYVMYSNLDDQLT